MKENWNDFINGNNRALASLYEDLFQPMLFVSIKQTQDPELSRDVVSEFFLSLLESTIEDRLNKWKEVRELKAFFTVIIRNKSIDAIRTKTNRTKIETDLGNHQTAFYENEYAHLELFEKSIAHLNEKEKELYTLHFTGYSNTEIGEQMNYSEKTVRNKLSLSRKKLIHLWKNLILLVLWKMLN
jgi:RNA polymerase sigma factor (sigma-70 family)